MGWLYMRSLEGHDGPGAYLDAQFTFERKEVVSKVLKSAFVSPRVYYAAVECVTKATGERVVWALVCLVDYNPRDREGFIFGYKDIGESAGPCETECPEAILDLLTETDYEYALEWRKRCRDHAAARRARAVKPRPRPGQTIVFDEPVRFADGRDFTTMRVVSNRPGRRPAILYQDPASAAYYHIRNIKDHNYRLVAPEQTREQLEIF
ncbi:hypothetical protein IY145_01310 [Methylosinus sp. H3A]|uniref:DUF6927 domain-containing protein n=1 Tax=Methylosinus sp. H3A TaxID=2785786 RepID=UPI0018C25D5C|nr:hypothetical protein [Methylosinus sp. H3A]MBG0808056.1 hypothetical protein [Methylosinus sp. H3A]